MRKFKEKHFLPKIMIALIIMMLFNFIAPNYIGIVSRADDTENGEIQEIESTEMDDDSGFSGLIISPFVGLTNIIADSVASLMQTFIMNNAEAVMTPDIDDNAKTTETEANVVITKNYGVTTMFPNFTFSCEEIFANKVPMLDINFLNPSVTDLNGSTEHNIAVQLQGIIKAWYRVLRLIAIVGLLSVLIYIGIRIMVDSNTENKAKYKERLVDWVVAFVILFSLHYIMSFTLNISEELTQLFNNKGDTKSLIVYYEPENTYFKTNLIGLARFKVQNDGMIAKISYEIVYIALLAFTVKFTVVYLRRILNMAFLTLISPLMALMYPLDKGSQSFSMWLKEYIFSAMLQPLHYLMYTVLISSAISLAATNPLYAIAALLFMTEAEKFLKGIFGFGKAKGGMVGGMSAFATGAFASKLASGLKTGKDMLGKGKSSELQNNKLPTMIKDTDIEKIAQNDAGQAPEIPTPPDDGQRNEQKEQQFPAPPSDENNENNQQEPQGENEQSRDNSYSGNDSNTGEAEQQQRYQSVNLADTIKKNKGKKPSHKITKRKVMKAAGKIAKTAGRTYVKAGAGLMAAAVEFGISSTDGKFSPYESVVSAWAGAKGADALMDGIGRTAGNLKRSASSFINGSDQAAFNAYQKQWNKDDTVDENFKDKYGENYQEYKNLASDELLSRGIKDFEEQKQCLTYADSIKDDMMADWEENEKNVIKQEHSDYSEQQVNAEFERKKAIQADEIRKQLKNGKKMSDQQAIEEAMKRNAVKEAATVLKFRKKADSKGALLDSDKRAQFTAQQVKALKGKGVGNNDSERRNYVNNAYNKVDKFDAVNGL